LLSALWYRVKYMKTKRCHRAVSCSSVFMLTNSKNIICQFNTQAIIQPSCVSITIYSKILHHCFLIALCKADQKHHSNSSNSISKTTNVMQLVALVFIIPWKVLGKCFPRNNKDKDYKLHHVGCFTNWMMMHGATNIKLEFSAVTKCSLCQVRKSNSQLMSVDVIMHTRRPGVVARNTYR
jgi:hypothetical protein